MGGDTLMYTVRWDRPDYIDGNGEREVQYLPDLDDVIRYAFGTEGATQVSIVKED